MGNVFEGGQGDARRGMQTAYDWDPFRKRYRQLTAEEIALHDAIKERPPSFGRCANKSSRAGIARSASRPWSRP